LLTTLSQPLEISAVLNFTWFTPACQTLLMYGFFAMTIFGAVYYIAPRLVQPGSPAPSSGRGHLVCSALGVLIYAAAMAVGGVRQGFELNDASVPFLEVMNHSLMSIRMSTLGEILMLIGNLLFLINVVVLIAHLAKVSLTTAWAAGTKTSGVAA
jgi:cytochrome c oxidase cbb3-type subunit 1